MDRQTDETVRLQEERTAKRFGVNLRNREQVVEHILREHYRVDEDIESTAARIIEAMREFAW
jgi:hypothetical protein